ncbi:MAG: cell wall-binding repeat-containing protein [Gracilibacteraceae bacterium]|jgi:putative cell wall-binding protein|nr:cell wall-binding repeat-containing protein [Gracilibacteraceae bacterium]
MPRTAAPFRLRRRLQRRIFLRGFCFVLALLLLSPSVAAVEETSYTNPGRAEIAAKLEATARAKEIPSVILKAIAYVESGWRQWDGAGRVVGDNPDLARPALGIMQITSYDPEDADLVRRLKYDIDFNIEYGADLLNRKWLSTPAIGANERNVLENWYFAVWAYHSWSTVNNPQDRAFIGEVPYQEAVYRRAAVEYFPGYVTPVEITRIDPELLPPGYLPEADSVWATPEPRHYGDLDEAAPGEQAPIPQAPQVEIVTARDGFSAADRLAQTHWPYGSETVIIARKDDFPDALAGVPLAAYYRAPILLTDPARAEESLLSTLGVLGPSRLVILGGEGAVSAAVETDLRAAMPWLGEIIRIAGADRYETAARIAALLPPAAEAALATGQDYPDALTLASVAAGRGTPLLLTRRDEMPAATAEALLALAPRRLLVAGGEGAVGAQVLLDLAERGLTVEWHRYAGADRYETSAAVAAEFYPDGGAVYIAEGRDYTDALPAAAAAAERGGCLLLADGAGIAADSATERYLRGAGALEELVFVSTGGNEALWTQITTLLGVGP